MTTPQRYRRRPVEDIQTDAERAAREFLGGKWAIAARPGVVSPPWETPGPTPEFFFALWDECKRRGWQVEVTGDNVCITKLRWPICHDGDPRHALIRCVCQWLDTQGGSDD